MEPRQDDLKKPSLTDEDFKALCSLLDEENPRTQALVARQFKSALRADPKWVEFLKAQKDFAANPKIHQLIEECHWEQIETGMKDLAESGEEGLDLEEGLYLLSLFSDASVTRASVQSRLDGMGADLTDLLNGIGDPDTVVHIFRQYLFQKQNFQGNSTNYYDPDNSFIHRVLERKTGIPVSLSSVCLLLAKRIHWKGSPLPLVGIGLPGHFILEFRFPGRRSFFDPFNYGKSLTRQDCMDMLRNQDIVFKDAYLEPVTAHAILCRTVTNLMHIYSNLGEDRKGNELLKFLQILNGEIVPENNFPQN